MVPSRFLLEPLVQGRESATAQVEGVHLLPRKRLRQQLRAARRKLPAPLRHAATRAIVAALRRCPWVIHASRIALYLAHDGEVDLHSLIRTLRRWGKQLYLPVVPPLPRRRLEFAAYLPGNRWRKNRFGIAEPNHTQRMNAHRLDLALTPLVGYTPQGTRLGMGGGFYDRSFAYRHWRRTQQPRLLGVGFSCQQCPQLPQAPWDVRLDGWVNEHELRRLSA